MALSDPHLGGLEGFLEERIFSLFLCFNPLVVCCPESEHKPAPTAEGTVEGEQGGLHPSRSEQPPETRGSRHFCKCIWCESMCRVRPNHILDAGL